MKIGLRLLGLAALLVLAPCAYAADVTGTWKGSFDFQGTDVPIAIHLSAAGAAVAGTVERAGAPAAEIHDGKVTDDSLVFWINTEYEGATYKLVFKGKIATGQIDFIFGTEDGSWGTTLTAKKSVDADMPAGPDANGTWKGAFDFEGSPVPLTFHLKVAAGVVTGTVEGLPGGVAEIKEGKMDGDSMTFSVMTDYQGSPVKLVYKGKLSAGEIKFAFGTEDGSWGTEMTAAKV
jgi:hypothetical protein